MITVILQFTFALFLLFFSREILNKLIPKMFVFISEEKNKDYVFAIIVAIFIFFNILFLKTSMKTFIKSEVVILLFKILYLIISSISIYIFKIKIYEASYYIYDYKFKIESIDNKPCGYLSNTKTILINQKNPVTISKTSDKKIDITINDVNNKIVISDEWKIKIYNAFNKYGIINPDIEIDEFKMKFLNEPISVKMDCKVLFYFHKCFQMNVKTQNKITLKDFIKYFTDENNSRYNYDSVKNGRDFLMKNTDVIDELNIFPRKPIT